jgi:fumarate hydratase class II
MMRNNLDDGMARYRIEKDILGSVNVPYDAYYGAETARAVENFPISGIRPPAQFIKSYALLKKCAAIANIKTGKLERKKGEAIVKASEEVIGGKLADQFVVDVFQAGAGTSTNMNLNEVIANRAAELLHGSKGDYKLVHPNDHVNMSQSTNDTYHMNVHLSTYNALEIEIIPAMRLLHAELEIKSKEFAKVMKTGRTHLQDAVPMTLGEEFSGYSGAVHSVTDRIIGAQHLLLESPLGGTAIGTGENAGDEYKSHMFAALRSETGLRFHPSPSIFKAMSTQLEELAVANALRESAVALNKIANDFRLLCSGPVAGFSDIMLPEVQPGSSIMPGKINPSMPEMLNMACFQTMGCASVVEQGANSGQLELNIWMPVISYNLLFSIGVLSNAVSVFAERAVKGVEPNYARLKRNLDLDMSIATALAPYIGYEKAALVARRAYKESKSVREIASEMRLLDKKTLDRILDPRNFAIKKRPKR